MHDPTARNSDDPVAEPVALSTVTSGFFAIWRRMIGVIASWPPRAARTIIKVARSWSSQWRDARSYHQNATRPWGTPGSRDREAAAALGIRAFVFGMIALAIVTASAHNGWGSGAIAIASEVLWVGMRFIIIALLMPQRAISRSRLSTAFLAGLLPYAFGFSWLLRLIALGASAVLTGRGLIGAGVPRRDSRVVIGWAFGGQAAVLASGWIVRAVVALLAVG